jgi:hypothetical protein
MASGAARQATGSFIGTGSAFDVRTVGFRPRIVLLFNVTGLTHASWSEGMAAGSVFKIINHASAQNVLATSNGITQLADGFTVGSDADINTAAEIVYYLCCE